ncbi:MAG: deoxyribose-phosphate aldolase [Capsulimonadales bacterium]|nr:deoxyribose-phosphate aldolase [Capsulimonadales bacterium]
MTVAEFARFIDHTLLRPDSTRRDARRICEEARTHGFAAACILPAWVADAAEVLNGSETAVCTVVGFPHGNAPAQAKAAEAATAVADGATEIDMVVNISAIKSGADLIVMDEIASVVEVCGAGDALVKVILECAYLTDAEKRRIAQMAEEAGADFVKTSTGFAVPGEGKPVGATVEDVRLLRATVGEDIGVKAAGGIRSVADARAMIDAGAARLGTSAGIALIRAFREGTEMSNSGY